MPAPADNATSVLADVRSQLSTVDTEDSEIRRCAGEVEAALTLVDEARYTAHRHILVVNADFAAALETTQKHTLCAQEASSHHLFAIVANWDTRRIDVPPINRKVADRDLDVVRKFVRENIYTYFYSEHPQNVRIVYETERIDTASIV